MKLTLTSRAYFSLVIAALCLMLLVACGSDDDSGTQAPGQTPSTAVTTTPVATVLITDARAQYCKARDSFKVSLEQVKTLTSNPSVDKLKAINSDIKTSWGELKAEGRNVASLQLQDLDKAVNQLQSSIDSLNQNSSVAAALASVALPALDVIREAGKVDIDRPCQT